MVRPIPKMAPAKIRPEVVLMTRQKPPRADWRAAANNPLERNLWGAGAASLETDALAESEMETAVLGMAALELDLVVSAQPELALAVSAASVTAMAALATE